MAVARAKERIPEPESGGMSQEGSLAEWAGEAVADPWAGLPRGAWEDVYAIAAAQGVGPVTDVDSLADDFWPADEGPDRLINAVRHWRNEDR